MFEVHPRHILVSKIQFTPGKCTTLENNLTLFEREDVSEGNEKKLLVFKDLVGIVITFRPFLSENVLCH